MFKSNEDLFRTLHNDEKAANYLQNQKIIKTFNCYKCNNILSVGRFNERYRYYCYKDNVRKGLYVSSIFERSNLRTIQIVEILRHWIIGK
jgi:hypothetical protein